MFNFGGCIAKRQRTCFSPSSPGFDSQCSPKKFQRKNYNVVNHWRCLEESRQWLEHADQTHLVRGSSKPALQKRMLNFDNGSSCSRAIEHKSSNLVVEVMYPNSCWATFLLHFSQQWILKQVQQQAHADDLICDSYYTKCLRLMLMRVWHSGRAHASQSRCCRFVSQWELGYFPFQSSLQKVLKLVTRGGATTPTLPVLSGQRI